MAKVFLPKIVAGNALMSGDTVFLGPNAWAADHSAARIAYTPDEADALLNAAEERPELVVGPYLVDVTVDDAGVPQPVHTREAIRMSGPSVRPDLTVGGSIRIGL